MPNSVEQCKALQMVAESVRVARARQRLSQQAVAERAGTSPARVVEIENCSSDPRLSTIERVLGAVGLELRVEESTAAADPNRSVA